MQKEDEVKINYISYKKLIIFGSKGSGKTSLAQTFYEKISHQKNDDNKEKGKIK